MHAFGLVLKLFSPCNYMIYFEFPIFFCRTSTSYPKMGLLQVSRPYKQAEFEIIFGEGVSKLVRNLALGASIFQLHCRSKNCLFSLHINMWKLTLFSPQGCILDCAEIMEIVVKKGSWYSYGDQRFVLCSYYSVFSKNIEFDLNFIKQFHHLLLMFRFSQLHTHSILWSIVFCRLKPNLLLCSCFKHYYYFLVC